MAQRISGPGQYPPRPSNLYPTELMNAPADFGSNLQTLAPGQAIPVPAGSYAVGVGNLSVLQWLDPVTGVWRTHGAARGQPTYVESNGFNWRVGNFTGCPISAVVAGGGTGFSASTATITANVGGSTWQAVVGGSLSVSTINAAGAGYTMPPLVLIPAPGQGGVPASGYATLTSGTVSAVSLTNFGAGYATAPTAVLLPNPTDPNAGSITNATVTLVLNAANAAKITAAICTNPGATLATLSALTLTAAGGAGSGATITPVILQTMTGASVVAGGTGFTGGAALSTIGGLPASVSAITNPTTEMTGYVPRPASALLTAAAGTITSVSAIYDGGLFVGTPTAVVTPLSGILQTASASVTPIMGSANDSVLLQPL